MESLNAPVTAMPDIQYASEMKFLDLEAPIPAPINDASETPPMMIDPSRAPVASKIGLDIRKVTSTSKRPLPPSPSLLPSSKKSKLYNVEDPRITELQNMAIDARVTNLEGDIASIKAGEKMVSKNLEVRNLCPEGQSLRVSSHHVPPPFLTNYLSLGRIWRLTL